MLASVGNQPSLPVVLGIWRCHACPQALEYLSRLIDWLCLWRLSTVGIYADLKLLDYFMRTTMIHLLKRTTPKPGNIHI
jgi:hypothetical protein